MEDSYVVHFSKDDLIMACLLYLEKKGKISTPPKINIGEACLFIDTTGADPLKIARIECKGSWKV